MGLQTLEKRVCLEATDITDGGVEAFIHVPGGDKDQRTKSAHLEESAGEASCKETFAVRV
jgi:hypothetical protein